MVRPPFRETLPIHKFSPVYADTAPAIADRAPNVAQTRGRPRFLSHNFQTRKGSSIWLNEVATDSAEGGPCEHERVASGSSLIGGETVIPWVLHTTFRQLFSVGRRTTGRHERSLFVY